LSTALLVVDMLNDFASEKGALYVPEARKIISNIRKILVAARESGAPVFYVCDAHLPDDLEFKFYPPHAVRRTWGAEVIDELKPAANEVVVYKRRYSGFFGTDLDLALRERSVDKLIVTGVLTDICVLYTVADAFFRGYTVLVVSDGTASLSEDRHRWALEHMREVLKAEVIDSNKAVDIMRACKQT